MQRLDLGMPRLRRPLLAPGDGLLGLRFGEGGGAVAGLGNQALGLVVGLGDGGGGGFLGLKLLVFYCCIGISIWGGVLDEDPLLDYGPPVVLTLMGAAVTGLNLGLLFG